MSLCAKHTSSLHNKNIAASNKSFSRIYLITTNDNVEMCYYERPFKSISRMNFLVKEFLLQNKGYVIKHEATHYEAIITNELRSSSTQWQRSVSCDRWLTRRNKNSIFPMWNKSSDDSFIRFNLCNSLIHEICMTNMCEPF